MVATAAQFAEADGTVAEALRQATAGSPPPNFQQHMGWVLIAFRNAFYHLAAGHSVEQGLIQTISQGGDTDTNAAIAGALLGAADGRASLPVSWLLPVLTCRPDEGLRPHRPRPAEYWPDDLLDLTEALLVKPAD